MLAVGLCVNLPPFNPKYCKVGIWRVELMIRLAALFRDLKYLFMLAMSSTLLVSSLMGWDSFPNLVKAGGVGDTYVSDV